MTEDPAARLDRLRTEALAVIEGACDTDAVESARIRTLGRKAPLSRERSALRDLPAEERRAVGRLVNEVQTELEHALSARSSSLAEEENAARWERERIDVTLPGVAPPVGAVHPLTKTIWEIVDIFIGLGYRVAEGPEVELSVLNFDALNTPPEHPARSLQDTYYIKGTEAEVCLRPQTSPVQMRAMQSQSPPLYLLAPGRVYRREETDPTHLAQFAQIEGLAVDEGITMGDLKGSLEMFARALFGKSLEVRLRTHFFPFTEPSAEMDVSCFVCAGRGCRVCKQSGWIEVLGCGMVDPFLFSYAGYEPDRYTGFAWGMGVERIAALAHGVPDIRLLYENDVRLLDAFRGVP